MMTKEEKKAFDRAMWACQQMVDAYARGKDNGGSVDWEDVNRAWITAKSAIRLDLALRPERPDPNPLLPVLKWAIDQMEGESGASASYWEEFPEYHDAKCAIAHHEGRLDGAVLHAKRAKIIRFRKGNK